MGQVETEAIVLRTYDLAEADRIVVCLTREAGMVRAVARGARRLRSRFGAGLEPFTHIFLSYYEKEGRELVTLSHLEIRRSYFKFAGSVEVLSGMAYMSELLMSFAPPHEPNERLYRMVSACLAAIEEAPEKLELIVRYFEVWLLKLAGFFSFTQTCLGCSRKFNEGQSVYIDSELRQLCEACGKGSGTALDREARASLLAMQRKSPKSFVQASVEMKPATQRELAHLTRRFIRHVLEREVGHRAVKL
jgi:DNA repair protein RecO (recombination protein O)